MMLYLFFILSTASLRIEAYNYLVISPVYAFSHMKFMATIANQLADFGHTVTFFQPFVIEAYQNHTLLTNPSIKILNYYLDDEGRRHMPPATDLSDAWYSDRYQSALMAVLDLPPFLFSAWEHMCRKIFEDLELQEVLKAQNFDVVIAETFDFCGLYLADYLESRSIISVFTGSRLHAISEPLGEPSWLHYSPSPSSSSHGPGSGILNRINDLYHKYVYGSGYGILFNWQFSQISALTNGRVRHWKEILKDVTFHFSNVNPFLDFPNPSISKVVKIGGYDMDSQQKEKPEKLSPELDTILNLRPVTIFVSFGSMVKSKFMPDHYKAGMLNFFKANSQNITFLWKYESPEDFENVPDNLYLRDWFPQRSLLADNRVKLFITHGGLGSTMELAYAAKPAIVIPLIAEQPDNAKMLRRHGSVEIFHRYDIPNWELLHDLTSKMLNIPSYRSAADRLALVLANQPIKPKDLMIKHAEMAAMFGKMPELTPVVMDMGVVEFYNLDIVLLFGCIVFVVIWVLWKISLRSYQLWVSFENGKRKLD